MTLRWRRGSGAVRRRSTLRVAVGGRTLQPEARARTPSPLGGWRRSLDLIDGPVPLHEGVLSRAGWYLLDDSATALMTRRPASRSGAAREGDYQDLYLFAYGTRLRARAARPAHAHRRAPLLPRKAFGVWFSRWWPYGEEDWRAIVERFRAEKRPARHDLARHRLQARCTTRSARRSPRQVVGAPGRPLLVERLGLEPRPLPRSRAASSRGRDDAGLEVGLNIHPSINSRDPHFEETQQRAGGGLTVGRRAASCRPTRRGSAWCSTGPTRRQLDAYFALHEPFERDGADFWWLDWCCDGTRAERPGPDARHVDQQALLRPPAGARLALAGVPADRRLVPGRLRRAAVGNGRARRAPLHDPVHRRHLRDVAAARRSRRSSRRRRRASACPT